MRRSRRPKPTIRAKPLKGKNKWRSELILNGRRVKGAYLLSWGSGRWRLDTETVAALRKIRPLKLNEICDAVAQIEFPYRTVWNNLLSAVEIEIIGYHGDEVREIRFNFSVEFEQWGRGYSIADYAAALSQAAATSKSGIYYFREDNDFISNGFGLAAKITDTSTSIQRETAKWTPIVQRISNEADKILVRSVRRDALVAFFEFPPGLEGPCQQYLLYFGQFLKDLGVSATTELKEKARHVLFAVTPEEGAPALQRVKEALELYLSLPGNPNFKAAARENNELAVQQLRANVLHFEAQLTLAAATLQQKDATIQALQFTNFRLQQELLSNTSPPKSLPSTNTQSEESLIGDTVSVKKFEGKFLNIDFALMLRRLKRIVGIS
jgi:hypothetical protein